MVADLCIHLPPNPPHKASTGPRAAGANTIERISNSVTSLNQTGDMPLIHRYETRLHMMYQRSLQNLALLRTVISKPSTASDTPAAEVVTLDLLPQPATSQPDEE